VNEEQENDLANKKVSPSFGDINSLESGARQSEVSIPFCGEKEKK
jgi:hypothetical protein